MLTWDSISIETFLTAEFGFHPCRANIVGPCGLGVLGSIASRFAVGWSDVTIYGSVGDPCKHALRRRLDSIRIDFDRWARRHLIGSPPALYETCPVLAEVDMDFLRVRLNRRIWAERLHISAGARLSPCASRARLNNGDDLPPLTMATVTPI